MLGWEQLYKIKIGGNSVNSDLLNMSASGDIQIIPVAVGAKKAFKAEPILFHKTIYDLKLFTKELQIESLGFLVNQKFKGTIKV